MKISDVEISNQDKIIFPEKAITKLDMIKYYERIAKYMLPYLQDRPLSLQRFPDGIDTQGFYQKNSSDYFPDFVETVTVETENGTNQQVVCKDKKTLIYLVNQGTVCFHIWLSKQQNLNNPDKIVFDLDPPQNSFEKIKEAAKIIGNFLRNKGKKPHLMTSGKSGFHVWYNIETKTNFDKSRQQAKSLADSITHKFPEIFTTATRKADRKGKIFIDYLRNAYGQTSVCPYALRPNSSCGIATPIEWHELSKIQSADYYHIKNIFRRLGQKK